MFKSYVWSLPTRVFHALFAIFITLGYLINDDDLLSYHAVIGYIVLILLTFRIIWGFIGPRHSRFKDFVFKKQQIKKFLKSIFTDKSDYIGHNPLASWVMISILITTFFVIITGILAFGIQEGKGIASFLNISLFKNMEIFKDIHEIFTNILLLLIISHLAGIVVDKLVHGKNQTLNSIFTGFKMTTVQESIKLNILQKLFAFIMFIALIAFVAYNIIEPKNVLTASIYQPINYEKQHPLFVSECASCHILYPPNLLPKKSWVKLMGGLDNHFGDDASLDEKDNKSILEFLLKNSAQTSTKKESLYFLKSINNKDIIAMSQTDFWKRKHKKIPKIVYKHKDVQSKANCKACHSNIEKGIIDNENIKDISDFM